MPTATEIRQQFIDFFCTKHGHTYVPSSPVVPHDDPTLLFANAGMNQFKDVFLGTGSRPYKRAANTQKCIRAGGKHNDLDDVGKDTYHHTFFEMLGNWSFGDYFKREAIRWAWELLTEVWKLDRSRLHVTVFEGDPDNGVPRDEEAAGFWRTEAGVDPAHIHYFGKKDNFWEMGETGPCGPCTEIHYDKTPDKSGRGLVNKGTDKVIEIWNLVFIQFNRNPDKSLTPLPSKHVDTGMGFERVTAVLQGKDSNYDTDVFAPIFEAIRDVTKGPRYGGRLDDLKDTAYRVIADHIRTLTFALTDGAMPSNEKRGYVLRSVLRRAERYGWQQLGTKEPFLFKLVPVVVELFGTAFPELRANPQRVSDVIRDEEKSFLRTLERGLKLFGDAATKARSSGSNLIDAKTAFDLHTEQGVFIDITEQMAAEAGLGVDRVGYERLLEEFRRKSGEGRKKLVITAVQGELPTSDDSAKYAGLDASGRVIGWVKENAVTRTGTLTAGDEAALLLDTTNFYAEQGGQIGDRGVITTPTGEFQVHDTQKLGASVLHLGEVVDGTISVGQEARLQVWDSRADTMKNHTATHLLNQALRYVLGGHVDQKGSLVDAEKTRFDFSHDKALSAAEIAEIERFVNQRILVDLPVTPVVMPLAEAKKLPGVRAVFGEKYPDPVRVLLIGPATTSDVTANDSVEFCGGTHLSRTGSAGLFKIISQEAVGKGVRRLTAITGRAAVAEVQRLTGVVGALTDRLNCKDDELPARVEAMADEIKKLQTQLRKGAATDLQAVADRLFAEAADVGGAKVIVGELPGGTMDQVRAQTDRLLQKAGSCVIVLGWPDEDKVSLRAVVTKDLTAKVHAGNLIKAVVEIVGGRGGGKPDKAEAGGKDPSRLGEALALARMLVMEKLGG
jgi:alanyl-tRNA synthetase